MVHGDMERQYCTLMGPSNYPAWSLLETYFICFCKRRYLQPMLSKVTCIPKFHMERLFPCESLPSKVFCFTGSIGEFSVIREVRRRQHIFSNVYSTLQFQPETQGLYLLLAFNPSPDGLDDHYLGRSVAVFTVSHTYACFWWNAGNGIFLPASVNILWIPNETCRAGVGHQDSSTAMATFQVLTLNVLVTVQCLHSPNASGMSHLCGSDSAITHSTADLAAPVWLLSPILQDLVLVCSVSCVILLKCIVSRCYSKVFWFSEHGQGPGICTRYHLRDLVVLKPWSEKHCVPLILGRLLASPKESSFPFFLAYATFVC